MHLSSSNEQNQAEKSILVELNRSLSLALAPSRLILSDSVAVQVDGVDEANKVVCEIYARIGGLKGSQPDKVASDLLKMECVEKLLGGRWRKIMCFADEGAARTLQGRSWLAAAAKQFGTEVHVVELPSEIRENLIQAQKRQVMVNP